jgi:CrcB protein
MDAVARIIFVGSGGFIGANVRYWLGGWMQERLGAGFPWPTMIINVTGSLVIGLFMALFLDLNWTPSWRLFVAIGILGGYTTFSTFAYEALNLLRDGRYFPALLYIEGSAILTVFGAWIGVVLARVILGGRA